MISKKAAAFLGTPPGEGGGGRGTGERRGGGSPGLHAPGAKRNGEVWGYPCARERSDEPLPLPGAAAPSQSYPGGVAKPYHKGTTKVRGRSPARGTA